MLKRETKLIGLIKISPIYFFVEDKLKEWYNFSRCNYYLLGGFYGFIRKDAKRFSDSNEGKR